jgi:SsrA-binding protein
MARQTTHQIEPNKPKNVKRDPIASGERDATVNRAAGHNYFLEEKLEAGIVLTGSEVKSVRAGRANLKDGYALLKDGELWLLNAHIGPYENAGYAGQKGYTLVPTRMYFKNGKIKCEIALAKGKQSWDKRETERRRTADKEAREAIARSRKQ